MSILEFPNARGTSPTMIPSRVIVRKGARSELCVAYKHDCSFIANTTVAQHSKQHRAALSPPTMDGAVAANCMSVCEPAATAGNGERANARDLCLPLLAAAAAATSVQPLLHHRRRGRTASRQACVLSVPRLLNAIRNNLISSSSYIPRMIFSLFIAIVTSTRGFKYIL